MAKLIKSGRKTTVFDKKEKQADADIAAGRVTKYDNGEALIADLEQVAKERPKSLHTLFMEAAGKTVATAGTYRDLVGKWKETTFGGLAVGTYFCIEEPDNKHYYPLYHKISKASRKLEDNYKSLKVWYDTKYDVT